MPKRIQHHRGQRLPEGAIYVGRPTKYGNPFTHFPRGTRARERVATVEEAVEMFRLHCGPMGKYEIAQADIEALRGHDLVCWCPPASPCHGDVLLAWANCPVER